MKTQKIQISDFVFRFAGYGHYSVSYQSPISNKKWIATINDMPLIDATKNSDNPKRCDLESLKSLIKSKS